MPAYTVDGHAGLNAEAAALTPEALSAETDKAEALLGFEVGYAGADATRATLAVVAQVNVQVLGAPGEALQSQSRGGRSWTYRGGVPLSPVALWLARTLPGWVDPRYADFGLVGSLR